MISLVIRLTDLKVLFCPTMDTWFTFKGEPVTWAGDDFPLAQIGVGHFLLVQEAIVAEPTVYCESAA